MSMRPKAREFRTLCPYCLSYQTVKAGRKLKFKDLYFEDNNPDYVRKYHKVPFWKCSICKNTFVLNMASEASVRMESYAGTDNYYTLISREEWENE